MRSFVIAAVVVTLASPALGAPTRDECVSASEDAQTLKLKGQLRAAREKLLVCMSDTCPKVIKQDCGDWLDEVDHAIPTVVLGARDPQGNDLSDVRVSIDGVLVADHLDGKAVQLDAGRHTIRFEAAGAEPKEESVLAREGEKNRLVTVVLGAVPAVVTVPTPTPKAPPKDAPSSGGGPSPAAWVVGGLGVATLAAAGVVGLVSLGQRSSLYDRCGATHSCAQSDVDAVYRLYDVSYVGAAVGGALVVTGVILLFATRSTKAPATSGVFIAPTFGGAVVTGRF